MKANKKIIAPAKIIKDDNTIGKYLCKSDGRTYQVTHLEKSGSTVIVCGKGINTKAGSGIIRMKLESWKKLLDFGSFVKK